MKTTQELPPPPPATMADELLRSRNQVILDHFSETQGPRVLKLMRAEPMALLLEMWRAASNLQRTAFDLAKARGLTKTENGRTSINPDSASEMRDEAYRAMFPAVETPESSELTPEQRRKLDDWLESLATAA